MAVKKGEYLHFVGVKPGVATIQINVKVSQKFRDRTTIWVMFTVLKYIMKSSVSCYRDTCASIFTVALFTLGNWVNLDA